MKARADAAKFASDFLFPGPRGVRAYEGIKSNFQAVVERAGLEWGRTRSGITFHTLRRTFATWAKGTGADDREIAKLEGWKTTAAMNRYFVVMDPAIKSVSESMTERFAPKTFAPAASEPESKDADAVA